MKQPTLLADDNVPNARTINEAEYHLQQTALAESPCTVNGVFTLTAGVLYIEDSLLSPALGAVMRSLSIIVTTLIAQLIEPGMK